MLDWQTISSNLKGNLLITKLGGEIKNARSTSKFKDLLLKFIRPKINSIYNIHDPEGVKFLTRLRFNFSHLREHKFRHNFRDTINPLCSCGFEIESTSHYLLRCSLYSFARQILYGKLNEIFGQIPNLPDDEFVSLLLFGNDSYSAEQNCSVLRCTTLTEEIFAGRNFRGI